MPDYTDRIEVSAPADEVFRFVSDVENLPRYLNTVHAAHAQGEERVEVEGEANHKPYHADGWFKVDEGARTLRWGSDGESDYSGEMRVAGHGHGSEVTCTLRFQPKPSQAKAMEATQGSADAAIRDGLRASLESLRRLVEGEGGEVTTPAET
jgi:uncharacterized membrane protein